MDVMLASIKAANVARYLAMASVSVESGIKRPWSLDQALKELEELAPMIGCTFALEDAAVDRPVASTVTVLPIDADEAA